MEAPLLSADQLIEYVEGLEALEGLGFLLKPEFQILVFQGRDQLEFTLNFPIIVNNQAVRVLGVEDRQLLVLVELQVDLILVEQKDGLSYFGVDVQLQLFATDAAYYELLLNVLVKLANQGQPNTLLCLCWYSENLLVFKILNYY